MKLSICLPLMMSLLLALACGNNHQATGETSTDTSTVAPSTSADSLVDDTIRRSDAAKDTSTTKPIGTPEEKIKNLK